MLPADGAPMHASEHSWSRRLARTRGIGPAAIGLFRLRFAARIAWRRLRVLARWWWRSREVVNHTYDLTRRNQEQLAAFLSMVTGAGLDRVRALMRELAEDEALRAHIRAAIAGSPDRFLSDAEPRYGRRIGWYVLVRLAHPRVVVETGVDKGLGACVLAAALGRNAAEGFPGTYIGIDPNPAAGFLLTGPFARYGRVVCGKSLERLPEIDCIDFFVHDSEHSDAHESAEYEAIEARLSEAALVLSDNAHSTDALLRFAERTKRRYLFFAERPDDHWYEGAGIGIAFR